MRAWLVGRRGLVAALVAAAAFAVAATAYWSGVGLGSTSTRLADVKSLALAAGTPTSQLYPGGGANVSAVVTNANPFVVHIGTLALDTGAGTAGFDVDSSHSACDVSALSFARQDNSGRGWNVPPQTGTTAGSLTIDMPGALTMALSAVNACQGAGFTVHLVGSS